MLGEMSLKKQTKPSIELTGDFWLPVEPEGDPRGLDIPLLVFLMFFKDDLDVAHGGRKIDSIEKGLGIEGMIWIDPAQSIAASRIIFRKSKNQGVIRCRPSSDCSAEIPSTGSDVGFRIV